MRRLLPIGVIAVTRATAESAADGLCSRTATASALVLRGHTAR